MSSHILNASPRQVVIFDNLGPEAAAMALALYSRDPRSVTIHLEKIEQVGSDKFIGTYYVSYGHKSIGDCGSTTICAELVSMLNAKSIQDDELYNGQEASTRYLDMNATGVLNPLGTEQGEQIQKSWMSLYNLALERLIPHLKEKYPMLETDDQKTYDKAIKARAFDIARGFLPAGCLTYVGWHTTLRKAWDHTLEMRYHPLEEVRQTGELILSELMQKYPNSFNFKIRPEQDTYYRKCAKFAYEHIDMCGRSFAFIPAIDLSRIRRDSSVVELLRERPPKTELPKWFKRYGQIQFQFLLDFGSFRDVQRHRSCTQIMPLLTTHYGFHAWYLDQLPDNLKPIAEETINQLTEEIRSIQNPEIRQYYTAMGYQVACELTCGLPSAVYIAELRSSQAVHPTLRPIAQHIGETIQHILPEVTLHCDMGQDEWSTIRGKHDIVKKENA